LPVSSQTRDMVFILNFLDEPSRGPKSAAR
jgi:hypothetical protein